MSEANPDPGPFFNLWIENTIPAIAGRGRGPIYVLCNDGIKPPSVNYPVEIISVSGNPGHLTNLMEGSKRYALTGWTATVCALAMIAYCNESDMIYKEQDCLAFGKWVSRMYGEIGDGGIIFGKSLDHVCAQSLFLLKHWFIPEFVSVMTHTFSPECGANTSEHKFGKLELLCNQKARRFSFGYDRDRPINFDAEVFYFQRASSEELDECRKRNLI